MGCIILFKILTLTVVLASENLIDYYEDLINAEIRLSSTYQFAKDASSYRPKNSKAKNYGTYDFVVIGSGSAGAVAASRLSEISKWNILVLEAGKEGNNLTEIPGMFIFEFNSKYNWGFNSTQQSTCCQARGGVCPFPRGKSLGGTSTINALVYSRGNKADYDKWASLGNPEWSYEKVLPFFIKPENSQVGGDLGYHGFGGVLNVEHHSPISKKADVFLAANRELGMPTIDVNGKHQIGATLNNINMLKGRRLSTEKMFLNPARLRPNLKILSESYVEKILIDAQSKTATGVLFSYNNTQYFVKINKEIVLSAGVVGSPHILMHSGIGPKTHLQSLNINVIKDLQVGHSMHDHPLYQINVSTNISDTLYPLREALKQYLNGTGPFTVAGNVQAISFFQIVPNISTAPDFELMFFPNIYLNIFINNENNSTSIRQESYVASMSLILLHPKTRGRIFLKSNDPFVYPLIDSKCLCDKDNEDLEKFYQGVKKVVELIDTIAFQRIGAAIVPEPLCEMHEFKSKDYWLCCFRMFITNAYHGSGTCPMGFDPRKGAVVDNYLKVHGVKKLRVADTSVIPVTISGHMNAPAMMVGERVADFIKREHLIDFLN